MMGGWEVLDTAVKIGLGAAITGLVTIRVTGRQLKAQSARELRKQRQLEWARCMELVVSYRKSLYLFNEEAGDYLVNREESSLEESLEKKLELAKARLETSLLELMEAHTRLGILDPETARALESYREAGDEFFREIWNEKDQLNDQDLTERWGRLEAPRERFFECLRNLERRVND